jgi:hypothetical protein
MKRDLSKLGIFTTGKVSLCAEKMTQRLSGST